MDPETFNCKNFPLMETLLLGDLDLSPTFGREDKHSLIFQNCSKMVTIDLANTNFPIIPKQAFQDMSIVENINISSNYILELDIDLKNNLNLKLLNVSFNLVKYLSPDMMHQLDKIANQPDHDLVLDLQHNPLLCGCEQLEFIKWMKSTAVSFHNFDSYLCLNKDIYHKVSTLSISDIQLQCKMEVIKISSSISATFLFIIMMGVVLYMKRHRMEYLFLLSRQMARRLIGRTRSRGNRLYKYHGFVCWSSQEDISIIVLIQGKLEMDFGLRLAIGDRDFEVGGYIIDNIVHFITASRKTIIFLSNNYLNSKWCMFELQVAMNKSQEVEFDTVVMILLHDINDLDKTKMPPSLTNYLKRKTYLQWPASSAQQPAFWLRLRMLLILEKYRMISFWLSILEKITHLNKMMGPII
ncbi:unnamed protein product [Owenia fusiformis]|uniref:Uncharacterized protein n=1 Tax=Owenia fusiformis TaxID=6347 RepID=A0A8J1XJM3_OWEFU|nr:unnamed protein product [Owenia fusiformis]